MSFVAREANLVVGPLTVLSTHATIDQPAGARRNEIKALLAEFDQAVTRLAASAASSGSTGKRRASSSRP